MNVETAGSLADMCERLVSKDLIVDGMVKRYQAVNELLTGSPILPERLVEVGAHSILLEATITYYLAVFAEKIHPLKGFEVLVQDGTIREAMYYTAVLVRLLNDMGTGLVLQTSDARAKLIKALRESEQTKLDISALLKQVAQQDVVLSRIEKDIVHGEFNLCLYDLFGTTQLPTTIDSLEQRLTYYSQMYTHTYVRLSLFLEAITNHLQNPMVSHVIGRTVKFHEDLYINHYSLPEGEYAV
jgi:hypothetical protein